jgi:hypothetical protein
MPSGNPAANALRRHARVTGCVCEKIAFNVDLPEFLSKLLHDLKRRLKRIPKILATTAIDKNYPK